MQAPGYTALGNLWPQRAFSFATVVLAAVIATVLAGCGSPQASGTSPPTVEVPDGLTLRVAMGSGSAGPSITVRWTWAETGPLADEVVFAFPDAWAGREGLLEQFRTVEARDLDGNVLSTRWDAHLLRVDTDSARAITLSYRVAPLAADLGEQTRFLPLLDERRFFAPGAAFVAQPISAPAVLQRSVRLELDAHAAGWLPQTTLTGSERYPIRDLIDAAYFAGAYEPVVAVSGELRVELWGETQLIGILDRVANLALSVIESQTELLGRDAAALTRIVVLERDDGGEITGTGRQGGFVLEVPATRNLASDRIVAVLAHENLHRLIGHTLTFGGDDEIATLWFREGVTDYLSIRLSIAAGLADSTALFASLSRAYSNYRANPAAALSRDAFVAGYWRDGDHRRLPYDLGTLLAFMLDVELHRRDGGSLLDFVAFLRDDPGARAASLTNATLADALDRHGGNGLGEHVERYVLGGEQPPLDDVFDALGLEVVERMQPAPYFGLRAAAVGDGTWIVREVRPESPAARAGVREGMVLAEPPLEEGPVEASIMRLRIVEGAGLRTLSLRGELGQRRGFAIIEAAGGSSYREALGLP